MSLKHSYTLISPVYDAAIAAATRAARVRSLAALPDEPATVLLSGVGTGLDLPQLPPQHRYTGIDLTPAMLRRAQPRAAALDFCYVQGDAQCLPFADGSFDAAILHLILAVVPDPVACLGEAARVLKPGGWLLWTDFRITSDLPEFREALSADFELVSYRDISANVLAAMAADAPRRQALIRDGSPRLLRGVMTYFAAASGETESVRSFARGERTYFLMQLRRRSAGMV